MLLTKRTNPSNKVDFPTFNDQQVGDQDKPDQIAYSRLEQVAAVCRIPSSGKTIKQISCPTRFAAGIRALSTEHPPDGFPQWCYFNMRGSSRRASVASELGLFPLRVYVHSWLESGRVQQSES